MNECRQERIEQSKSSQADTDTIDNSPCVKATEAWTEQTFFATPRSASLTLGSQVTFSSVIVRPGKESAVKYWRPSIIHSQNSFSRIARTYLS
jgi:hypothetical protein